MQKSVLRLEKLKISNSKITETDRELFEKAGNELSEKAINEPGRYLKVLQDLKRLSEEQQIGKEIIIETQKGLLQALPEAKSEPQKRTAFSGKINDLLLKELELND